MTKRQSQDYDVEGNWTGLHVDTDGDGAGAAVDYSNTLVPTSTPPAIGSGMNQYQTFRGHSWGYSFTGAQTASDLRTYLYDRMDRLIEVRDSGSTVARYIYDAENRRMQKLVGSTPTQYLYDGWRVLEEDQGADGITDQRYIWANGVDRLLAVEKRENDGNWSRYYIHGDPLGSTRAITDSTGARVTECLYGAFGELLTNTQHTCSTSGWSNPYMYTGQRFDPESGLYYYKNRYYDPQAGRFLTRDPAGYIDGANLYRYARNSPTSFLDPLGMFIYDPSSASNPTKQTYGDRAPTVNKTIDESEDRVEREYAEYQRDTDEMWEVNALHTSYMQSKGSGDESKGQAASGSDGGKAAAPPASPPVQGGPPKGASAAPQSNPAKQDGFVDERGADLASMALSDPLLKAGELAAVLGATSSTINVRVVESNDAALEIIPASVPGALFVSGDKADLERMADAYDARGARVVDWKSGYTLATGWKGDVVTDAEMSIFNGTSLTSDTMHTFIHECGHIGPGLLWPESYVQTLLRGTPSQ